MSIILDGTNGETFPTWTTATRPASPNTNQLGYNSTYGGYELWNGSAWSTISGGPAFSAYQSIPQTGIPSGTFTKIIFQTKEFDTNNNFDNTTNYRFTPTIPGYYQVNAGVAWAGSYSNPIIVISKNGVDYKDGGQCGASTPSYRSAVNALVYCNGSTDYLEIYGIQYSGSTVSCSAGINFTYFQACLIRGS